MGSKPAGSGFREFAVNAAARLSTRDATSALFSQLKRFVVCDSVFGLWSPFIQPNGGRTDSPKPETVFFLPYTTHDYGSSSLSESIESGCTA